MPYYGSVGYDYDVSPPLATYVGPRVHWTDGSGTPCTSPHAAYIQYNPMTKEDTMPVRLTQQQIDTLHDLATQTGDRSALTVEHSREHRSIVVAQVHGRTLLLDDDGSYIDAA